MSSYSFLHRINTKLYANIGVITKDTLITHLNAYHVISVSNAKYAKTMKYFPMPGLLRIKDKPVSFDSSMQILFEMSTNSGRRQCWNCAKTVLIPSAFCENCGSLQPINAKNNSFDIFNLKQEYDLDLGYIKRKYRELQTDLHPDKFSLKSKKEQELSEEYSAMVNKAYATLLNPLERGLYILSLHNISIEEGSMEVDKEFLMEIMERNEEIENETDPENLKQFNATNREKLDSLIKKTTEAFKSNDLQLATKLLTEMKYYNSIDSKIKEIKQKLNIPD